MGETRQRLEYVDILKGMGILLVLVGHILPHDLSLKSALYAFHMPLFFVAYGMVARPLPVSSLLRRRSASLLIPYLFWGLAFSGMRLSKKCLLLLYGSGESIRLAGSNGMLWFLVTMFLGAFLANFVLGIAQDKHDSAAKTLIVAVALGFLLISMVLNHWHEAPLWHRHELGLPLGLDVSFLAASFILAGHFLAWLISRCGKSPGRMSLVIGLVATCGFSFVGSKVNTGFGNYPSMQVYRLGSAPTYWFFSILACYGMSIVARALEKTPARHQLVWLGQHSMAIFIVHKPVRDLLVPSLSRHYSLGHYLYAYAVVLIAATCCAYVLDKLAPKLIGRR